MFRLRLTLVFCLFFVGFSVVSCRLFTLQVIKADYYREKSIRKSRWVVWMTAPRGRILDRQERVLAEDVESFDLQVSLADVGPVEDFFRRVRRGFADAGREKTEEEIRRGFERAGEGLERLLRDERRRLKRELSEYELKKLQQEPQLFIEGIGRRAALFFEANEESFPGLSIRTRYDRYYPYGRAACHLIGQMSDEMIAERVPDLRKKDLWLPDLFRRFPREFVLTEPYFRLHAYGYTDPVGLFGLERQYQEHLRGRRGVQIVEKDFLKKAQGKRAIRTLHEELPQPGRDLAMTLDAQVQQAAEEALSPYGGAAVVLDPRTGELLALASSPGYDLNASLGEALKRSGSPLFPRAVQGQYAPGSVFKLVTAVAGIESGTITPATSFTCTGYFTTPTGRKMGCWSIQRGFSHGPQTLAQGIENSCNVYFLETARRLPRGALAQSARRYGFGSTVCLDVPGEADGQVPEREIYNVSIGQGSLLTTPLQVASFYAQVANGGRKVRPFLIRGHGEKQEDPESVATPGLEAIRRGLRRTVLSGTAHEAGLQPFRAAGKTGTAQVVKGKTAYSWFAGYAPFDQPEVVIVVVVEEKGEIQGGGHIAAPLAAKILKSVFPQQQ